MAEAQHSRAEHVDMAKRRALQYVDLGDVADAMASLFSDLNKHPDTRGHPAIMRGAEQLFDGRLQTPDQARDFIREVQ